MTERALAALGDRTLPHVTPGAVMDLGTGAFLVLGRTSWYLVEPLPEIACGYACECPHWRYRCAKYELPCFHIQNLLDWLRRRQAALAREKSHSGKKLPLSVDNQVVNL
jgi:hypothetical protein